MGLAVPSYKEALGRSRPPELNLGRTFLKQEILPIHEMVLNFFPTSASNYNLLGADVVEFKICFNFKQKTEVDKVNI